MNTNGSSKSTTNLFSNIAKNAQATTTAVANQVGELASNIAESANSAVNAGLNMASNAATTTVKALNNVAQNIPIVNSLMPANTGANNARTNNARANNGTNAGANNTSKNVFTNNAFTNMVNNAVKNMPMNTGEKPSWFWPVVVFVILAGVVVGVMVYFKEQVKTAYDSLAEKLKAAFGVAKPAPAAPAPEPEPGAPGPAGTAGPTGPGLLETGASVLSKILPSQKEVFNVNANDFTFYDAEPMCRALGAELATYDQVKDAWSKGANWCNYGWTKGQMAVYPTQKEFYEKLQSGPPSDQAACGTPGVNGGFFDNPEMRFGVNCYGVKPSQTQNDVRLLEEKGAIPQTPETLAIDQKAQEYKDRLGSIGVLPFSEAKWSAY